LLRKGAEAVVVNSVYTTADHEVRAKTQGAAGCGSLYHPAAYQAERLWIEHILSYYEKLAYTKSQLVLYNYDSVARLFLAKYGPRAETRKLRYSTETAFLHDGRPGAHPDGMAERVPEQIARLQPHDAPLVVSVSRHDPRKGLDILIRALA